MTTMKKTFRTIYDPGWKETEFADGYIRTFPFGRQPSTSVREVSVEVGENLPDWRDIIKRGDNATTSLTGYDFVQKGQGKGEIQYGHPQYPKAKEKWKRMEGSHYHYASLPGALAWQSDSSLKSVIRAATEGFVSKCLDRLQPVNGLQFVGELKDTIKLVTNPLGAVVKLANRLKHKKLGVGRSFADSAAELRLQWAFGVKPLISDIDEGIQALGKIKVGGGSFQMVKKWSEVENASNMVYQFSEPPILYRVRNTSRAKATVRGIIDLPSLESDGGGFAYDLLGFNKYNIPRTVWELVPFSFLADYFLSIGETLDALALISSGGLRWHHVTTRVYRTQELTSEIYNPNGYRVDSFVPAKCFIEESNVVRVRESPALDLVYYPRDTVGDALTSANKVANMAALATLALGRYLDSNRRGRLT